MEAIEKEVRCFIIEHFLFGSGGNGLKSADSLLEKGVIDSTGVLELVSFLETTFHFKVEDHEIIPDHLDSIGNIVVFVDRKKKSA
ncbi:MAG: acyl carrier protein [Nitrospirota bacterium]